MKSHKSIFSMNRMLLAGLFFSLFAFTACDSSNALLESGDSSADLAPSVANLSENLSLTEVQSQEISEVIAKRGENQPGTLWYVAAELQSSLTEDQKEALFAKIDQAKERIQAQGKQQRRFKQKRGDMSEILGDLSDEQKAELKALREGQRETMKALVEQRRAGELDEEAMRAAASEIRAEMEEKLKEVLTEEQFAVFKAAQEERAESREARRENMQARRGESGETARGSRRGRRAGRFGDDAREEFSAAKIEALGLTDEQQASIETLRAEQKEKAQALFEGVKENGGDREAIREQVEQLREESKSEMAEILTEDQLETITIHRALAFQAKKNRSEGAQGKRGQRRFNR